MITASTDETALRRIIAMSQWAGDPARDLVILAEGNTSLKVGDGLLVKASGASLEGASSDDFVLVSRKPLLELIESGRATDTEVADALSSAAERGARRASVETLLHVVCQQYNEVSAVIHTHPTPVNALLCSTRADELIRGSYFPDQIVTLGNNPLLVPYIDPGLELAHHAQLLLREHITATGAIPKVIYLQNHGMFALGADPAEAQRITAMAVKTARMITGALSVGEAVPLSTRNAERIHSRPDEVFRRQQLSNHE